MFSKFKWTMGKSTLVSVVAFQMFLKVTTKFSLPLDFSMKKLACDPFTVSKNRILQARTWQIYPIAQLITKFHLTMGILAIVTVGTFHLFHKLKTKFSFVLKLKRA